MTDQLVRTDQYTASDRLLANALFSPSHPEQWAYLSAKTGMEVNDLRGQYFEAVARHLENPSPIKVGPAQDGGGPGEGGPLVAYDESDDEGGPGGSTDITIIPGVVAIKVEYTVQMGDDWKASVTVTPTIFGNGVGSSSFELSRTHATIDLHPSVVVAKADLTIGFSGEKLCFGVSGQACYLGFGWQCQSFSANNLFCLLP
ncbi:hypothetical protein K3N28_15750 [Glycomyces sp. TRM65418]|uniref:hypothetical protein n=1 Tax=Glycomyces sp. TRM65418 TaxID=2867006 RepID=UPI001CE68524|nr:hypothetical protein [Glycomyces sp. TRM65418]MCC3764517.1 hypothetical protein [Glycomyces sp. TRM65418]QZD54186.1 hypothetical protein K3N28_15670 [Glycomyces sp. TRM65418]